MSKMRSASSSTSTFSWAQSKYGVSSMCCRSRPGVQMRIFIPSRPTPATERVLVFRVGRDELTPQVLHEFGQVCIRTIDVFLFCL